ncbi:MAG: geranylgeranylglyceryl/heptaprenylglyceryl phosphate synthase [Melioribacteraceae bacterium]|jgi:putative glycerol-1-phosphate prenyltransferase|nr:geranylgeranylglyceryl/heptaprenylglyceryl phosphate synthase [Ignavibacteriota bacterium]MBZ0184403.1 geranylgeranylglyceryl/heptaprenylglyceryl phosphate synthase [Melioribacteraceae bacterium]
MKIYNNILKAIEEKGAAYFILIDPDKISENNLSRFLSLAEEAGVDGFLLGGSLLLSGDLKSVIKRIKEESQIPIIIFPGSVSQVLPEADALLYISLISGRNADHIIGNHVLAAPMIKKSGIEPISTGYILVESGKVTTAEYMSGSKPIPRNKPEIAVATALAAEFMGMKMVYLEGGSGAELTVPNEMVKYVSSQCSIPVIVGGGIRDPKTANEKVLSGAKVVVTGNYFEKEENWSLIKEFADAIHYKLQIKV